MNPDDENRMNRAESRMTDYDSAALVSDERLDKLEKPPRLTLKEWGLIILLFFIAVVGVHQYDNIGAHSAAKASAHIVYQTQLEQCEGQNNIRGKQRKYFATVAKGRAISARTADAMKPTQRAVDEEIARVAHGTAAAYVNRQGALPNGELDCKKVTKEP